MTDLPIFRAAATNFHDKAVGFGEFASKTFSTSNEADFKEAAEIMVRVKNNLQSQGIAAHLGGVHGKSIFLACNGYTLRVSLQKPAKQTDVRETSKEAFYTSDFSTQEGKVAQVIMAKTGEDITRAEIAYILGIQEGRVSGRVNALLHKYRQGGFFYSGKEYRLVLTEKRLSRCPGASRMPNEGLRFEKCESAPEGVQTRMF